MANLFYPKFLEALWKGLADLSGGSVKIVLVDTSAYTYAATDEFLSDIPIGARIATSPALSSKTFTNGVFDAADSTITSVSGATVELAVFIIDTGTAGTSRLCLKFDTATGLVLTPDGNNVIASFNASGIAALG